MQIAMYLAALLGSVLAQRPASESTTPAIAASSCSLHVWPAGHLNTLTEGAFFNNTQDSGFNRRTRKSDERLVPPDALPAGQQAVLLGQLDLGTIFHHPGARATVHTDGSARRAVGPSMGRQTNDTSSCYVEITVARNFFNRSSFTDRTLRSLLIFDDFAGQAQPVRSFVGWASTNLVLFPAKDQAQADAADKELAAAFTANVRQFATSVFTPRAKRRASASPTRTTTVPVMPPKELR